MASTSETERLVLTNPLEEQYGGTNQNSYNTGDLLYASGTNILAKLPIGTDKQILTSDGTTVSWQNTKLDLFYGPYRENTADTTTISGLSGTVKWVGGVLAPNGKIYGIPFDSTSVLIIPTGIPDGGFLLNWALSAYHNKL